MGCRFLWHFDSLGRGRAKQGVYRLTYSCQRFNKAYGMFDTLILLSEVFFFLESIAELCTRIYRLFLYFSGLGIVQVQHKHKSFSKSNYEFRQATGLVLTSLELQLAIITGCAAMRAPHLRPWLLPNNFLTKLDSLLGKIGRNIDRTKVLIVQ